MKRKWPLLPSSPFSFQQHCWKGYFVAEYHFSFCLMPILYFKCQSPQYQHYFYYSLLQKCFSCLFKPQHRSYVSSIKLSHTFALVCVIARQPSPSHNSRGRLPRAYYQLDSIQQLHWLLYSSRMKSKLSRIRSEPARVQHEIFIKFVCCRIADKNMDFCF